MKLDKWLHIYSDKSGVKFTVDEVADVRENVKGEWITSSDMPDRLICNKCNAKFDMWKWEMEQMHFCPNCGADMRTD